MRHPDFLMRLLCVWLSANVLIMAYFIVLHYVYEYREKRGTASLKTDRDREKRRARILVIDRYPSLDGTANSGPKT